MRVRIFFEDSPRSRLSIITQSAIDMIALSQSAELEARNQNPGASRVQIDQIVQQGLSAKGDEIEKKFEKLLVEKCKKEMDYEDDLCKDIINNAIWEGCRMFDAFKIPTPHQCNKKLKSLESGYPWYWGLVGMFLGGILIVGLAVAVYFLILKKKKGSQKSKGSRSPGN